MLLLFALSKLRVVTDIAAGNRALFFFVWRGNTGPATISGADVDAVTGGWMGQELEHILLSRRPTLPARLVPIATRRLFWNAPWC